MSEAKIKLGQLITGDERRDAVHIAICPVVAAQTLKPGGHVGQRPDGTFGDSDNPVGIVDPFLRKPVLRGPRSRNRKCKRFALH